MKKRIVCITDCSDIAYSELRGTIISELITLGTIDEIDIEPVISVQPFSIINGCFSLRLAAESYPEGTIFLVVLNPMQIRPERIFGRTKDKNFIFLGANTGVFHWFLRDFGIAELYELKDLGFVSFGGKYVHAPAAARLASGISFNELGSAFDENKLRKPDLEEGTIVHIDNFGLIKFAAELPAYEEGQKIEVTIGSRTLEAIYSARMMSNNTGTWVIYKGSSFGFPELGKVREDGAHELGVKVGAKVSFRKK